MNKKIKIFISAVMVISLISSLFILSITNETVKTVSYTWGSKGRVVYEIQSKLKEWKYYDGKVDGVYGYNTWSAVRKFQSKNGIKVDGIAGNATLAALGIDTSISDNSLALGSTGEKVKDVQRKLARWGYYSGKIDGDFGYKTWLSVRSFQRKNGIRADGVVGPSTFKALGINVASSSGSSSSSSSGSSNTKPASSSNDRNIYVLAAAIYGEARGEPYTGQVAVGAVILNRTRHASFPNTIAGVVYQPGAFDAVRDGQINLSPNEAAYRAARDSLNGWDPTGGCIYYWNPATATSKWIWSRPIVTRIGKHVFAK